MTYKKILVAIDFSPSSARALELSIDLAKRFDAALCVVHIEPPFTSLWTTSGAMPLPGLETVTSVVRAVCEKKLLDAAREAREGGVASVGTRLLEGAPWSEIVELAKQGAYDLLVIGTQGRSGVSRIVLGSVAERVLREAPCAVLAVRQNAAAA